VPPPSSSKFQQRLLICGADERNKCGRSAVTHIVSVANPGASSSSPSWFTGAHLQLWFGDVVSEEDAKRCKSRASTSEDIQNAIGFFRKAWRESRSRILVTCDYGASRSPALACVFIADQLGIGREAEAFDVLLGLRPDCLPNGLVIRLGDSCLNRQGALLAPFKTFQAKVNTELFKPRS